MKIIHLCPSNIATGGTESIHNLIYHLNMVGADAKILYVGNAENPQPIEYAKYKCNYLTELPDGFKGVVIFPEIWGNRVLEPQYKDCIPAIHWQGVDVYDWCTPKDQRNLFLQRKNVIHITNLEYGMDHLRKLGLTPIKVSDALNDDFFKPYKEESRSDIVLYNPTNVKLTQFQKDVMAVCKARGIEFKPIQGYSRAELIDLMRHSKLYIDFGVFSGRERLPREAVMCGCCILTSKLGAAGYYRDNSIKDFYKMDNINTAIEMILYVLEYYDRCRLDFDETRRLLIRDKNNYLSEVENLYNAFLSYNSNL